MDTTTAFGPGRVTLLGEHTGPGGLACALATDLGVTTTLARGGPAVRLVSDAQPEEAVVALPPGDPALARPRWARLVAGVAAAAALDTGGVGTVTATLPVGIGLASGAALVLSLALALGVAGTASDLALLAAEAVRLATGTPAAWTDVAAVACARAGHVLLLDDAAATVEHVALPPGCEVVVVHPGVARAPGARAVLRRRRAECARAEAEVGPLRRASRADVERLADPLVRARARHVVAEHARVAALATALRAGDLVAAGRLLAESHAGLRDDYAVSTPALDSLAARLAATPGVFGARAAGRGLGGPVVALARPGVLREGWRVQAASGARTLGGRCVP